MKKDLVLGGGCGISLSITLELLKRYYDHIYIMGKIYVLKDISEGMEKVI